MRIFFISLFICFTWVFSAIAQPSPASDHANLRFLTEHKSVEAGSTIMAGLHIEMDEDWHVYWRNPGDSGIPVRIQWNENEHVTFGSIQWPYPTSFKTDHLVTYGYNDETLLFIPIEISGDAKPGIKNVEARVEYLVCKEICLPGFEDHTLQIDVSERATQEVSDNSELFEKFSRKIPDESGNVSSYFSIKDNKLHLQLEGDFSDWGDIENLYFYAGEENKIESSAGQNVRVSGNKIDIELTLSRYINETFTSLYGVIVIPDGNTTRAIEIEATQKQS